MNITTIKLRRDGGRVEPGHSPWIRNSQIAKIVGPADPAGIARLVGPRDEPLGWGLYSPDSTIRFRGLTWSELQPSPDWLAERIAAAFAARTRMRLEPETTGYRAVNSEGDGLPGLVVDRYGDHLVVQLTTAPMVARQAGIVAACTSQISGTVFISRPESAARREGFAAGLDVVGESLAELGFVEAGVSFCVPAPPGQKTGAYFDQRDNRRRIARLVRTLDGPILDLGCYVGGFALHAAREGVTSIGVDKSSSALAFARRNADQNRARKATWVEADIFGALADPALAGPFSVVVFDPPKVAASKANVRAARQALTRALSTIETRVRPGGILAACSCSHHVDASLLDRCLLDAAGRRGAHDEWTRVGAFGPGLDHPVALGHTEGHYLQMAVYRRRSVQTLRAVDETG